MICAAMGLPSCPVKVTEPIFSFPIWPTRIGTRTGTLLRSCGPAATVNSKGEESPKATHAEPSNTAIDFQSRNDLAKRRAVRLACPAHFELLRRNPFQSYSRRVERKHELHLAVLCFRSGAGETHRPTLIAWLRLRTLFMAHFRWMEVKPVNHSASAATLIGLTLAVAQHGGE